MSSLSLHDGEHDKTQVIFSIKQIRLFSWKFSFYSSVSLNYLNAAFTRTALTEHSHQNTVCICFSNMMPRYIFKCIQPSRNYFLFYRATYFEMYFFPPKLVAIYSLKPVAILRHTLWHNPCTGIIQRAPTGLNSHDLPDSCCKYEDDTATVQTRCTDFISPAFLLLFLLFSRWLFLPVLHVAPFLPQYLS